MDSFARDGRTWPAPPSVSAAKTDDLHLGLRQRSPGKHDMERIDTVSVDSTEP